MPDHVEVHTPRRAGPLLSFQAAEQSTPIIRWALGGLLVLSQHACGDVFPRSPAAEFRDSSGIAIVTNNPGPGGGIARWTLSAEPDLVIDGEQEGGPALASIEAVASLSDGSLIVFDGRLGEVHLFSGGGEFQRTIAAPGPGPGELSFPSGLTTRNDTILVLDNGSIVVFGPDGGFVREEPLFDATLGRVLPGAGPASIESLLADGRMLVRVIDRSFSPPERGVYRIPATYAIWDRSAESVDTLGTVPANALQEVDGLRLAQPFGPSTFTAVSPDGFIILGDNASHGYRVFDGSGELVKIVRIVQVRTPIGSEHRAQAKERFRNRAGGMMSAQSIERAWSELVVPDSFPSYVRILVDTESNVWLQSYGTSADSVHWRVMDAAGRLLANVQVPAEIRPLHISSRGVLGVYLDSLEVPSLRRYSLER